MKQVICVAVCVAYLCGTPWEARGQEDMFAEEIQVSPKTAVMLSVMFPGLGQMASGHKQKGGVFFLSGLISLVVAVDGHEQYDTRRHVYETSRKEYDALRVEGNHREAEAKWKSLEDLNDDLDSLHNRRQIFGYAVAGIYAWNVIDILRSRSEDATAEQRADDRPAVSLGLVGDTTGIVVSKTF